jgi:hypothetical protein
MIDAASSGLQALDYAKAIQYNYSQVKGKTPEISESNI